MESKNETSEKKYLGVKTESIVRWLQLADVPSAAELDPDNKMGLQDSFKKDYRLYPDVVPQKVIENKKQAVLKGEAPERVQIPLLETQHIGTEHIPLFKEQIYAAAQQLVRMGVNIPEEKLVTGESFIMGGKGQPKTRINSNTGTVHEKYKTKDPNISVEVVRQGQKDSGSVKKVFLSIHK